MTLQLPRRSFLLGLGSALAAPAIVRASSLMPVSAPKLVAPEWGLTANLTIGSYNTAFGFRALNGLTTACWSSWIDWEHHDERLPLHHALPCQSLRG